MTRNRRNPGRPLIGDALRERVSFTLSPEMHRKIKLEAKSRKLSKSEIVEQRLSSGPKLDQLQILSAFTKLKRKIDEIAKRNEIRRLCLFGSILTGEITAQSDIDLLVEFKEGSNPGLFQLAKIEMELSEALSGNKVDLRTTNDLSSYFRKQVQDSAVAIYES